MTIPLEQAQKIAQAIFDHSKCCAVLQVSCVARVGDLPYALFELKRLEPPFPDDAPVVLVTSAAYLRHLSIGISV